jgi:tRNA threonylcarbamoyladenosine biosynthesis protein TsaB
MSPNTSELRWLAFDTSTDVLSLAVARGDRVWTQTLPGGAQSSSGLIPAVLAMLAEADMTLASLTAIVFGRGPGSFTGLRTACAVAQGLAFGADIPVLPVDTLLAVAEEARWQRMQAGVAEADVSVLAMLDARMDEVYSAAYQWSAAGQSWQAVSALQVSAPEKVQAAGAVLAGNVFEAYGPRLNMPGERCVALPTAAALLRLAPALWAQGLAMPAEQAMPLYIRDKVANTTAEREAMKAQSAAAKAASNP